jgi:putative transposase
MSERRFGRTPAGLCLLGLQVVWCLKYRRRILGGRVARGCAELLEQIAAEHGWQMAATEVMPDHVHLFVSVAGAAKGRTARVLGREFGHLGSHAKVLWSPSYVAASAGDASESRVRRSIAHRWDAVAW